MWEILRPYVWSFVRHGVVTGATWIAAKTGIHVDDATVNGVAGAALQGTDLLVAAVGGVSGSLFSNFGALKALVGKLFGK